MLVQDPSHPLNFEIKFVLLHPCLPLVVFVMLFFFQFGQEISVFLDLWPHCLSTFGDPVDECPEPVIGPRPICSNARLVAKVVLAPSMSR